MSLNTRKITPENKLMTTSVERLLQGVAQYRYNPAGIQREVINLLSDITQGAVTIVDPTNPVVFNLEAAATLTSAFMSENALLNRMHYPASAQTPEDIYPHMSDKDFVDVYAVPSMANLLMVFDRSEVISKLVEDTSTGVKKLVIPRNTTVRVVETTFSLQYPIEIRQLAHGGIQIVYDVEQKSPLLTLSTNLVPWGIVKDDNNVEYLMLQVMMHQFDIVTKTASINRAQPSITDIEITDQYCYTRVWVDNADGTLTEMAVTYTDAVYDARVLTAVVKVVGNSVSVKIPQVYINSGLLGKSIRIDVYQTKGELNLNLANYTQDQYEANWNALNKAEMDQFTAPLKNLSTAYALSQETTSGGKSAMSFEQLRARVMNNAIGYPNLPITPAQIESVLNRSGYVVVKNIDNVTNRMYLATRPMPDPVDSDLITAAAAGIGMLAARITEAVTLSSVVDNGNIITITPDTLYRWNGGILNFVSDAEKQSLEMLPVDRKALAVSEANYMFTPFHYVLETTERDFEIRPYYLDNPQALSKSFIAENDTTLYQVATDQYTITRVAEGYKLTILTRSSDTFKEIPDDQVFVQLAYLNEGEVDRAYLLGTLVGRTSDTNERIYEFNLKTNYSINAQHEIGMTEFKMYDDTNRVIEIPLELDFDVMYSTDIQMGNQWVQSPIDLVLGAFQLPGNTRAVTQESIKIRFGYYLEYLWARSRSVVSEAQYQVWETDVPALYTQDVYLKDPDTGSAIQIVDGAPVITILHRAGDPVIDANGDPVYKFRRGDIKLDAYNQPIVRQSRDIQRQMDIFLIEASYYFATNQVSIDYRSDLVQRVVQWLVQDLPNMGADLLEQTRLRYYPTNTIGAVNAMIQGGLITTMDAGQAFELTLYVDGTVYADSDLREALTRKSISTIGDALKNRVVSMSSITETLKAQYAGDVTAFSIKGLGGNRNLDVATMTDDSRRLSIKKQLVSRNDATLAIEEAVAVNFVRHQRDDTSVTI
jgi:hypothetical protein